MSQTVYFLCALTSFICAFFQWKAYAETKGRFLLYAAIGFSFFVFNNILLVWDFNTPETLDLSLPRSLALLGGLLSLLLGFILEVT